MRPRLPARSSTKCLCGAAGLGWAVAEVKGAVHLTCALHNAHCRSIMARPAAQGGAALHFVDDRFETMHYIAEQAPDLMGRWVCAVACLGCSWVGGLLPPAAAVAW